MPACLAAADIGVAPFDTAAHPPLQLAFYWSPLKVFEYMAAGLPVVAPAIPRLASIVGSGREGLLYDPEAPGALADALAHLADHPDDRRRFGASARERAVREFSWAAHCRRLDRGHPAGRSNAGRHVLMRILIATDAYPPVCGGSGWSTFELVRGLVGPRPRRHAWCSRGPAPQPTRCASTTASPSARSRSRPPSVPFFRNYVKNERLWPRLAARLRDIARAERADILHAQHTLTAPAAVEAGRSLGVPVVCTVRDYWPRVLLVDAHPRPGVRRRSAPRARRA